MSEAAPSVVPSIVTFTPGNGSPVAASVTTPAMRPTFCATTPVGNSMSSPNTPHHRADRFRKPSSPLTIDSVTA
ncbi:hypothetical protein [Rhodothermus marinus]|uniref:hypothetical protein n=1 Tax=Rhodothermus marinus TaxID=29549 RepID=UPI000A623188|nr:hypothetical protein [Rhodothermus marinus]